jgi:hypothetical protein
MAAQAWAHINASSWCFDMIGSAGLIPYRLTQI